MSLHKKVSVQQEERRERALLALPARRGRFLICCFLCAAVCWLYHHCTYMPIAPILSLVEFRFLLDMLLKLRTSLLHIL